MSKAVLLNVLMNIVFSLVFLLLNNWALQNSLEETFIALALAYGAVVIVANALYIFLLEKSRP